LRNPNCALVNKKKRNIIFFHPNKFTYLNCMRVRRTIKKEGDWMGEEWMWEVSSIGYSIA
jgi:hypothetical protein